MAPRPYPTEPARPGSWPEREASVFRSRDLEVIAHPGASRFLMITFAELGMRADGRRWWAAAVARRLGIPALGFVATGPNWFPEDAVAAAVAAPAVAAILDAHPLRITYGFSMGGHAAIRHARALGAEASLAIAPQWSIDPTDTGMQDRRFQRHFDPARNAGMRIAPTHAAGRTYILLDPHEPADNWHCARIRDAIPRAVMIPVRATGHWISAALAGSETARSLLAGALAGDEAAIRQAIASKRRNWRRRPFVLARQLARRRPGLALRIVDGRPTDGLEADLGVILERAAEGFLRDGRLDAAEAAAARALALAPDSSHATGLLAEAALRKGEKERAVELARRSAELAPASPGARFRLAAFLRRTGQSDLALEEQRRGEDLARVT